MSNGELITEGVTRRCVPLSQGAQSPDLRVNYEFGLVLGVDEFRQEQHYQLENSYLHNRSLHGYGTVCGLHVTLEDGDNLQVRVSPGIGVDQAGRTFVVRDAQCASLNAWLEQQDSPDEIDEVYVVARYDECLDALVPIRGEPCSSGEEYQAASRIRRTFQLNLEAAEPPMPTWAAVQQLARVMSHVQLVPELAEEDSDESAIIELVRLLLQPSALNSRLDELRATAEDAGISGWKFLRLPEGEAQNALDRILTVWVTEMCPQLQPDQLDPEDDVELGILLARLQRAGEEDEDAVGGWRVIDEGRPYLLSTQMIQSLLLMGGAPATEPGIRTVDELVSVDAFDFGQAGQRLGLRLWFHTEGPVSFEGDAIQVVRIWPDGREELPMSAPSVASGGGTNRLVWEIAQQAQGRRLRDADMLEIRFQTDRVQVGDRALTEVLRGADEAYLGYDGETTLTTYYVVDAPPREREAPGGITEDEAEDLIREHLDAVRTVPFVTITPTGVEASTMVRYELWFHVDLRSEHEGEVGGLGVGENIDEEVSAVLPENMHVFAELENQRMGQVLFRRVQEQRRNIYTGWADARSLVETFGDDINISMRYARFVFPIESQLRIVNSQGTFTFGEYMRGFRVKFDGYYGDYVTENGEEMPAIVVYVRVPQDMELPQ